MDGELHTIDALTVTTLSESLARTIELIDDEQADVLRQEFRASLRLIEGGEA